MIHRVINRKRRGSRYPVNTDAACYTGKDSGCQMATAAIGKPSICLENCPFEKCIYDMTYKERRYIQDKLNVTP